MPPIIHDPNQISDLQIEEESTSTQDLPILEPDDPSVTSGGWGSTANASEVYSPVEPHDFEQLGLSPTFIEHLVLKHLLDFPGQAGHRIANHVCLNASLVLPLLQNLKRRMLVRHATGDVAGDFCYDLTEAGRTFAMELRQQSPYAGPAPVPMETYRESVIIQSISGESLSPKSLEDAFADLVVDKSILDLLGPAMASGKGVFLFGNSGNGKTSLALRMSRAYTYAVYIPHAILMGGRVVQVYDPQVHRAQPRGELAEDLGGERLDKRWVRCHRPVVVAGGELTLDSLELEYSEDTGLCEAPLQLKANCGLLLIDDFGRQRVDFHELLNRWILPLENRVDFLRLPNGRKVQTPFDPLLVFSTNLDPGKLVDEAFIRRIPYKIHIPDPTPEAYRTLLEREAEAMGFAPSPKALDYLVRTCYTETKREMRYCHPRDLLLQVRNQCLYRRQPLELTRNAIDSAARGYFTLL